GGEELAVLELRHAVAREAHRFRLVEEHRKIGVGVRLVLLHEVPVGPRVQPPIHATDVVAGDVASVLGEVDRRAEVRRAMQAVDEAVDDRAREQLEILDPRKDLGIDEPRAGNDVGFHVNYVKLEVRGQKLELSTAHHRTPALRTPALRTPTSLTSASARSS